MLVAYLPILTYAERNTGYYYTNNWTELRKGKWIIYILIMQNAICKAWRLGVYIYKQKPLFSYNIK